MNIHLNATSSAKQILSREILTESFKTAIFIGIILNLINNSSAYSYGEDISGFNVMLNFIVPFVVSTYSSVRASYLANRKISKKRKIIETSYKTSVI